MNPDKITAAAKKIKAAQEALAWLRSYSPTLRVTLDVRSTASELAGFSSTDDYLRGALQPLRNQLISDAVDKARRDIEEAQVVIAAELATITTGI
jgi:hypothetical protein